MLSTEEGTFPRFSQNPEARRAEQGRCSRPTELRGDADAQPAGRSSVFCIKQGPAEDIATTV